MEDTAIQGERIYLRPVAIEDANKNYCRWINNPEVTKYTESRFSTSTIEDIKAYIAKEIKSDSLFFAIVLKENDRHIGNMKIHRTDKNHKHGEISLLIGETSCWRQGIATEAIKLLVNYVFTTLNFHKVYAGCYANNVGSIKAFKKAGFQEEGLMKEQYLFENKYIDAVLLGRINNLTKT
jgi:RimJ/RimL family protein N-acetyltransferase